jgi:predicted transcriptional regulator
VGVSKVGGIFVHKSDEGRFDQKSTTLIRETTMKESLSSAQEAQAQKLAQAIAEASYDDILHIARTLVATDDASLFGDTEFTVRALSHGIAAKAYRQHLEQKKTATKGPA